jgi:hypothetical protein
MHARVTTVVVAFALTFASASAYAQNSPEMPTRVWAGQIGGSQVMLRWDTVSGASEYRLYQRIGTTAKRLATAARNAQFWVIPVTASMVGTTLQYQISAVHPNVGESAIVPFNTITVAANAPPPPAPTGVMAALRDSNEILLRWDSVPGATGYAIGRSVTPYGFTTLCMFCPTATQYVDEAVTPGRGHTYTVEAISSGGRSRRVPSNMVVLPLPGATGGLTGSQLDMTNNAGKGAVTTLGLPRPPISLLATTMTNGVRLMWYSAAADSASAYVIERAVNLGAFKPHAIVAGDKRDYLDPTLPQVYESGRMRLSYRVTARNRVGDSPVSAQTSAVVFNPAAASTPGFCALEYKRANTMWADRGKATPLPGLESLRLNPGANQLFNTDWSYEGVRNNGRAYYGAHLRQLLNTGSRDVVVYARSLDPSVVVYTVDAPAARNLMDLAQQAIRNTLALSATKRHGLLAVRIAVHPGDVIGVRADLLEVVCPSI